MPISKQSENRMLDALLGSGTPGTVYVGLMLGDPVAVSPTPEPVEPPAERGYERVSVVNNDTNFPPASNGVKRLATLVSWPEADGGPWGQVRYLGVFDALEGGDLIAWSRITRSVYVTDGRAPYIIPDAVTFSFAVPEQTEE